MDRPLFDGTCKRTMAEWSTAFSITFVIRCDEIETFLFYKEIVKAVQQNHSLMSDVQRFLVLCPSIKAIYTKIKIIRPTTDWWYKIVLCNDAVPLRFKVVDRTQWDDNNVLTQEKQRWFVKKAAKMVHRSYCLRRMHLLAKSTATGATDEGNISTATYLRWHRRN